MLPLKVLFTYSCIYLMLSLIEEKIGRLPIFFLVLFTATRFQKPFEKNSKKFGNNFCQIAKTFFEDIHPYKIDM